MKIYTRYLPIPAIMLMLNINAGAQEGGDAEKGAEVFKQCAACHMIGENAVNAFGPVLTGVVGRPAGSYADYPYSNSIKAAGEGGLVWTKENLFNWLENPAAYIKSHLGDDGASTKMPVTFPDPEVRNNVIAFLVTHSPMEDKTMMEEATETASETMDEVTETASDAMEAVSETASDAADAVSDAATEVMEKVTN